MKLKFKLFLSIFPLALGLLTVLFSYVGQRESWQRHEQLDAAFAATLSALGEFQVRQEEALKLANALVAQTPVWGTVTNAGEKELQPVLASFQKQAPLELVFFAGADGVVRGSSSASDRWPLEEMRIATGGFFARNGELRKRAGFLSLGGKIYQIYLSPVSPGGYVGVGQRFPFENFLKASGGFETALSGREGNWQSALNLGADDSLRLTNSLGDDVNRLQLAGATYYVRTIRLDPETPAMRVAALLPAAAFDQKSPDTTPVFLFCLLVALLASIGISWGLSLSISRPLETVARAVKEMGSSAPAAAPASLTERRDEVGAVATSFNLLTSTLSNELRQKEKAVAKLEKTQAQLLDLNTRLAKKLFENRVMLSLWKEQEKAEDTKDFLSRVLEEMLQGLPFQYGCVLIRPLAEIGPEVILARIERSHGGKGEISVTDILERSDRTLWLSSLSPDLKEFLLKMNQETAKKMHLVQEQITAAIEPDTAVRNLRVVSARLAQGNQHMGSLHLIAEKELHLAPGDEEFIQSVAGQVSVALDNRSLQYATRVDPLTRLYNRGYMNDRLREEMLRTSRTNHPFTLMLLDIDHFKKVNDSFGHPAGDEILVGLSSLLKRSCRASDAICRYGGEEIALILVDTPIAGAKIFAENIRKTIETETFTIPEGKSLRITASMGLAEFPSQAGSMGELIKHADDALYKAKREGRNVWRSYTA